MIHIFTTGGTIEGIDCPDSEDVPGTVSAPIDNFLKTANVLFPYILERAFQKDSRTITSGDRKILLEKIKNSSNGKILITHGTYTMAKTASYLGQANLQKTIVLVGSFILGSSDYSDVPFNLGYAISSLEFLKPDVYIAMNGTIFHWNNVAKNLETNRFERKNEY